MNSILWPEYFFKAALDYLSDRNEKPAIIIDNTVMKDGVLSTREKVSGDDCVICISPSHVANFDIAREGISFSARFDGFQHHLNIPYEAITAIYAYDSTALLSDDGEVNMLVLPKVVLPPGAIRRKEEAATKVSIPLEPEVEIEDQPREAIVNVFSGMFTAKKA